MVMANPFFLPLEWLSIVNDTQPSEPILLKTAAICKATCDKEASH